MLTKLVYVEKKVSELEVSMSGKRMDCGQYYVGYKYWQIRMLNLLTS